MAQYNSVNVNLSNAQIENLKSATKKGTGVNLRLPMSMIGTDEANLRIGYY